MHACTITCLVWMCLRFCLYNSVVQDCRLPSPSSLVCETMESGLLCCAKPNFVVLLQVSVSTWAIWWMWLKLKHWATRITTSISTQTAGALPITASWSRAQDTTLAESWSKACPRYLIMVSSYVLWAYLPCDTHHCNFIVMTLSSTHIYIATSISM